MITTAVTVPAQHAFNLTTEQPRFAINRSVDKNSNKWFRVFHSKTGFYKLSAFFYYGDRVKISFGLQDHYLNHYVLIKGLLEFHRSKDYKFSYSNSEKSFELSVDTALLDSVHQFLENVTVWVDQELEFKQSLKKIIQFESDYKAKAAEVYQLISK